jgi:hypothetical protein
MARPADTGARQSNKRQIVKAKQAHRQIEKAKQAHRQTTRRSNSKTTVWRVVLDEVPCGPFAGWTATEIKSRLATLRNCEGNRTPPVSGIGLTVVEEIAALHQALPWVDTSAIEAGIEQMLYTAATEGALLRELIEWLHGDESSMPEGLLRRVADIRPGFLAD